MDQHTIGSRRDYLVFSLVAAACLAIAAIPARDALNPDAVAYLRIAGYWLANDRALAISGYWGPMLSWLVAAMMGLGLQPLTAARVVMALSGLFFALTALAFVGQVVRRGWRLWLAGGVLLAVAVQHSISVISPDLLMAGWMLLGASALAAPGWRTRFVVQAGAGLAFGLAFMAKAVALPASIGLVALFGAWRLWTAWPERRTTFIAVARTGIVLVLTALPWIVTVSAHYHRPLFSTAGPINHALIAPDGTHEHPFMESFYDVPAGRITTWEDPSPDSYKDWSPFASADALRLQLGVMAGNAREIVSTLRVFDFALLTLLAAALAALALVARRPWIRATEAVAVLGCAVVFGLYLPVFSGAARYYIVCIPLLIVLGLRVADLIPARWTAAASLAVLGSLILGVAPGLIYELRGGRSGPLTAETKAIMDAMQGQPPGGLVAAGHDGRPVLHAAFRLGRTFNGFRAAGEADPALVPGQARFLVLVEATPAVAAAAARLGMALPVADGRVAIYRIDR